jgi:hypothetical protein
MADAIRALTGAREITVSPPPENADMDKALRALMRDAKER